MCAGDIEQHGGGPAGCGSGPGRGVVVSAVQLHLLSGVEGEEPGGVGQHQSVADGRSVDELRCHVAGLDTVQQVQDGAGTAG